jgi:hypothetical protein
MHMGPRDNNPTLVGDFPGQYKGKGNIVARCLVKIHEDPIAHSIFHAFHTLDSSRLRSGFDRYRQDPERYLVVDGTESIDEIHEKIIERVATIPTLIRNAKEDEGNRFLKPIRFAASAVATGVKKVPHPKKPTLKKKAK